MQSPGHDPPGLRAFPLLPVAKPESTAMPVQIKASARKSSWRDVIVKEEQTTDVALPDDGLDIPPFLQRVAP
jgi:hypothetical protein